MKLILILFMLIIFSCQEDYKRELNNLAFQKSDSMYNSRIQFTQSEADSLCHQLYNNKLQHLIDSIINIRREQIEQLRKLE